MDLESSFELLQKAQGGDDAARDRLLARYRPRLFRWASGRLPRYARDFTDTDDLVQVALIGFVTHVQTFEYKGEWSLQAYLRTAVINEIRQQIRKRLRIPDMAALPDDLQAQSECPHETAVGKEVFARYDAALDSLTAIEREAVIAWVELGCSYKEIMLLVDRRSVDAARMFVVRALEKVARAMVPPGGQAEAAR